MPAPKGNKYAVKGPTAKTAGYRLTLTPENLGLLKKIAEKEKCKISDVFEKALLEKYPEIFDGKF